MICVTGVAFLASRVLTLPLDLLNTQRRLDQPPDRLRAGGLGLGLAVDPGGNSRLQLVGPANRPHRIAAGGRAAAASFLYFGY